MTIYPRGVSTLLLLSTLILLLPSVAPAQDLINLGTLPGLNPAQAQVGSAIDVICPQLAQKGSSLTSAQQDLLGRCSDMKVPGRLSLGQLPDVLGKVTSEETSTQGTSSIETRTLQVRAIGARLAALRLGATGLSLSGLGIQLDGKSVAAAILDLNERAGGASADGAPGSRVGAFVNGLGSFGSKDRTNREQGFDFHSAGVTAGVDYRFTDNLVAGLSFSYLRTKADLNFTLGDVESRSPSLSLYGTYYVGPVYVDVLSGFTWHDYDTARRIVYSPPPGSIAQAVDRTARGDTDGRQFTLNVGAGYDFRQAGFTMTPYARMEFLNLDIDGYRERGADGLDLRIKNQTVESLLTVFGGRVAYALSVPFGVLVPQVRGEWRHEHLNDQRSIRALFANDPFTVGFLIPTDSPYRDYFAFGTGIASVFKKGVAAFLDFETVLGLRGVTNHNLTAGVRIEF